MTSLEIDLAGDDLHVGRWIWRHLVPPSGQSSSVQGELLRAVEKLRHEAQANGNVNWDEGFEMLVDYLGDTLIEAGIDSGPGNTSLTADLQRLLDFDLLPSESNAIAPGHRWPYIDDDLYERLVARVVIFCRRNPRVIPRAIDPTLQR